MPVSTLIAKVLRAEENTEFQEILARGESNHANIKGCCQALNK